MIFFSGIDWSDSALEYELLDPSSGRALIQGRVKPDTEGMASLFARLEAHASPEMIGIALEANRGPWVQALLDRGYRVYPVNPRTADHFRKALSASGEKSDRIDAHVLATFLASCHSRLRALTPDDPALVALRIACEDRLRLVEERTAKVNELQAALKQYYPAMIGFFGDLDSPIALTFLMEFPTQRQMQALKPPHLKNWLRRKKYRRGERIEMMLAQLSAPALKIADHLQTAKAGRIAFLAQSILGLNRAIVQRDDEIGRQFEALPESDWISSLPGAGPTLGPALLACIGRDARRFEKPGEAQALMGTAPVTRESGQSRVVFMRRACWKFARRTLQLFAEHARRRSGWSAAFYERRRECGCGHHAALRALAHKWLKIILAMQRTGTRYDERVYLHSCQRYLLNAPAAIAQTPLLRGRY